MTKIVRTQEEVLEFIDWVKDKEFKKQPVALDTETTGLKYYKDKIHLIQVGDPHKQWVFDCAYLGDATILFILKQLASPHLVKIAHNAKFDYGMILGCYGIDIPNWRCTMLGNELLIKGVTTANSSLAYCVNKYLGRTLDKTEQSSFSSLPYGSVFTDSQLQYAADDVKFLVPMWDKIEELLKERDMELLAKLENETLRVVAELELNGIMLDQQKWLGLARKAEESREACREVLDDMAVASGLAQVNIFGLPDINYSSPAQVKEFLEKLLNRPIDDTNSKTLEQINHPFIEILLEYRGWDKKASTYGQQFVDKYVDPETSRVYASYHQLGTDTGRMSSSKPNGQNIPNGKEYRACFVSPPGYKMISADFSSQELRLLAQISKDERLIKANRDNLDVHSYSASLIYDIPYEEFLVYDEQGEIVRDQAGDPKIKPEYKKQYRTPAKTVGFGLIYGMGVAKLADTLKITLEEARQLRDKYFEAFPGVKQLMEELAEQARERKYAYSPLDGRRRDLSYIDWDNPRQVGGAMNEAKNMPFQGCGASTTKLAMVRIKNRIDKDGWDAKIVASVHDELLYECREDQAQDFAQVVAEEMCIAFNKYAPDVPMVVKPDIGTFWIH